MPKYSVDVKALICIEVEAENPDDARKAADRFAETGITTGADEVGWYNNLAEDTVGKIKPADYSFEVDGVSDVERLCAECSEYICESDNLCADCEPEPVEPPLDTPSLDTSFHDHEMDV